jgi:hypothetical protein
MPLLIGEKLICIFFFYMQFDLAKKIFSHMSLNIDIFLAYMKITPPNSLAYKNKR